MKLRIKSNGKKFVLFLPLSPLLVRLIVKAAVHTAREGEGQECDEREKHKLSFTAEEKKTVVATAVKMAKALKKYRRRYGKLQLAEIYSADDGDEISVSV